MTGTPQETSFSERIQGMLKAGKLPIASTSEGLPEESPERPEKPHVAGLRKAGIGERFWDCSFDNYRTETEVSKVALETCKSYVEECKFEQGLGIFLVGIADKGKTHLFASMLRETKATKKYLTIEDYFVSLRSTFGAAGKTEKDYIESLTSVSLLILDDLGKLKGADSYEQRMLWYLLDKRYQAKLGTAMSTNLGIKELKDCFEARTLRRLEAEIVRVG